MLIDDMVTTMADYRTLGLSAPQVRQSLRIIVANVPHNDGSRPTTLIIVNPTLTVLDSEMVEDWEGCGSLPEVRARVSRARSVVVRGVDRMGAPLQIRATGRGARVLQHGLDHLDGVLFVDRMRTFESLVFREYAPPDTALL
jgi:peptide deformylase